MSVSTTTIGVQGRDREYQRDEGGCGNSNQGTI